jgi:hypothetical protein
VRVVEAEVAVEVLAAEEVASVAEDVVVIERVVEVEVAAEEEEVISVELAAVVDAVVVVAVVDAGVDVEDSKPSVSSILFKPLKILFSCCKDIFSSL